MAIGPDGTYPFGSPTSRDDRGGLYAGFSVLHKERLCAMQFGTVLTWISGSPVAMLAIATLIRHKTIEAFGRLTYDKSTLPLKVVANRSVGVIEVHLPRPAETLAANPEMWLALAEVIETTAKQIKQSTH